MEPDTKELVERLKTALGDKLTSVILYGSAAVGDRQTPYSDYNIFCVLPRVGTEELAASGAVFHWWRKKGNPAPLLMAEEEVRHSTDCFPMEFFDMQECRKVLHGRDVVTDLPVDSRNYRTQVEYELRSKLLRLRQKAAGLIGAPDLLLELMSDSVTTFLVLARHVLRLSGVTPAPLTKEDVVRALAAKGLVDVAPFERLLARRKGEKLAAREGEALLAQYLAAIGKLIEIVDGMEEAAQA